MIALWIILAHLVGDYLIQSDWMANEKTKRWWPAIAHGLTYTIPYVLVTQSLGCASCHCRYAHHHRPLPASPPRRMVQEPGSAQSLPFQMG
jgi:hypothetical protein